MGYALVTGSAKGIGRAISIELARYGIDLLLVDYKEEELLETASLVTKDFPVKVHLFLQDLSKPDAGHNIKNWYESNFDNLQILVNNAGFGINGFFRELPLEEQLDVINVNIRAQVALTYLFLPILEKQKKAYILNLGSTTAYQTVPFVTMYSASKHFVVAFNRGLHHEIKGSSVSLTCLSPGATDTDFVNRARMGPSIKKTAEKFNMTAEEVAKIGVKGMFKGKREVIPGWYNKIGAFLPKFFPESFVSRVVGKIYDPRKDKLSSQFTYNHIENEVSN
jgi:short-subunit dehydrogenase